MSLFTINTTNPGCSVENDLGSYTGCRRFKGRSLPACRYFVLSSSHLPPQKRSGKSLGFRALVSPRAAAHNPLLEKLQRVPDLLNQHCVTPADGSKCLGLRTGQHGAVVEPGCYKLPFPCAFSASEGVSRNWSSERGTQGNGLSVRQGSSLMPQFTHPDVPLGKIPLLQGILVRTEAHEVFPHFCI